MPEQIIGQSGQAVHKTSLLNKTGGCHNCSKRRIVCDQSRPHCNKCLRRGLECPGYGVRYRFNEGVASRGKLTGRNLPVVSGKASAIQSLKARSPNLVWPDGTTTTSAVASTASNCDASEHTQLSRLPEIEAWALSPAIVSQRTDSHLDSVSSSGLNSLLPCRAINPVGTLAWQHTVPQEIDAISRSCQSLLDCFSKDIAPVMVVLDGKFNGYRDLILPLAWQDELVRSAVCVVSMYHLSVKQSDLRPIAESGFHNIVRTLSTRASAQGSLIDMSAWTTIIILLVGETVSGSDNFPHLFKLLQHLSEANMKSDAKSVMHAFLAEQTRMMTLFAQPLLGEHAGVMTLRDRPERYFDFITNAALFHPAHQANIETYKTAIHQACTIYLNRAICGPPHAETTSDLEALRNLCVQIDPDAPGHHTLVWVYFVAAAESSTLEHRDFFTSRLQEVFSRTKFHNIPIAIAALQDLWRVQGERKWTEVLPEVMPVFII